jgi:ribonuclease T2
VPFDPSVIGRFAAVFAALLLLPGIALAAPRNAPGDFDFYVLALSWSPSYCAFDEDPDPSQCRTGSRGFIVHGLWPQYERGYPSSCPSSMPRRVPDGIVASLRDIMPSGGLVGHEWRTHGLCTGLYANDYFTLVRRAFQRIRIPEQFAGPSRDQTLTPAAIESAFAAANPGLSPAGMSTDCEDGHFNELRICLDRQLNFRRCVEIDRRSCRTSAITVPAVR